MNKIPQHLSLCAGRNRAGVVLLITLVLLVVLSTLGYTLSSCVTARRHRNNYIIDYAMARYACDSALKYSLAMLEELNPQLISRPNEPDFSDVFALSKVEYEDLLAPYATNDSVFPVEGFNDIGGIGDSNATGDSNGIGDINEIGSIDDIASNKLKDSDDLIGFVRGPYGPPWPLVAEPVEFEVGTATVRIEIEDENAKYPIGWVLLDDEKVWRETAASFDTFCEWMAMEHSQIESLRQQLIEIGEIKPFKVEFKSITKTVTEPVKSQTATRSRRRTSRMRRRRKTISASDQIARQNVDFIKLFQSSLLDTEMLAKPAMISESREESPLKYLGMWASSEVNINTAPRHVLEAALTFGGPSDAPTIAEEIIQLRRIRPLKNLEDLKKSLFSYSDSIDKCKRYITTTSGFFTVRVTAVSGLAKASAIAPVTKSGERMRPIAVISN
jgi:hypothetical protein